MNTFGNVVFLVFLTGDIFLKHQVTAPITRISNENQITSLFFSRPNQICNLPRANKAAICKEIFDDESIQNEFYIRLNKAALYHRWLDCELHSIEGFGEKQLLLPCYGRHAIISTSWYEDGYYQFFYLSDGPVVNSVFLYKVEVKPDGKKIKVFNLVQGLNIENLPPYVVTSEELVLELGISVNRDQSEVETRYFRTVVVEGRRIPNRICALSKVRKIQACKAILGYDALEEFSVKVDESSFTDPTKCVQKPIRFSNNDVLDSLDGDQRTHGMFPCHLVGETDSEGNLTEVLVKFQLADGFRKNSIIAFYSELENNEVTMQYEIYEFFENVAVNDVAPDDDMLDNLMIFDD